MHTSPKLQKKLKLSAEPDLRKGRVIFRHPIEFIFQTFHVLHNILMKFNFDFPSALYRQKNFSRTILPWVILLIKKDLAISSSDEKSKEGAKSYKKAIVVKRLNKTC